MANPIHVLTGSGQIAGILHSTLVISIRQLNALPPKPRNLLREITIRTWLLKLLRNTLRRVKLLLRKRRRLLISRAPTHKSTGGENKRN